jgi:hypothetical protein
MARRYEGKVQQLRDEVRALTQSLMGKAGGDGQHIRTYPADEIAQFEDVVSLVIERVCEIHGITGKKLRQYQKKLAQDIYPDTTPYETFDSLGGNPRTLIEPLGQWPSVV